MSVPMPEQKLVPSFLSQKINKKDAERVCRRRKCKNDESAGEDHTVQDNEDVKMAQKKRCDLAI